MSRRRLLEAAPGLLALLWPALYLAPFLLPGGLQSRNDFWSLYWKYKAYLLDALAFDHRIPGWSPSEGCGYPFLANPFTAALYPLNLPLAVFDRLAGGYSLFDHQVFTVLGLCIFSAGLYAWLRESGVGVRAGLVATLVMGTSVKMTELQRFPNAMHAAAWFPWLLLGIAWCRRRETRGRGMVTIAAATILLATAGYPYFLYYAQFLVLPYAAAVGWPRTRDVLFAVPAPPERRRDGAATSLAIFASLGAGVLVCWPYLRAIRRLMSLTTDRMGASLDYATQHSGGVVGTLGSLVFPPAASAEGWFYFGQLPLLFLILFLVGAFDPGRRRPRDQSLALLLGTYVFMVASLTWGARSPLFRLLWEVWPGFRTLRVWPRLDVVLVPALALLLARGWDAFERMQEETASDPRGRRRLWGSSAAAIVAVLSIVGLFLASGYTDGYWQKLTGPSGISRAWAYPARGFLFFAAGASVLLIAGLRRKASAPGRRNVLAAVLVLAAAFDTGTIGLSQWAGARLPSDLVRQRWNVEQMPERSLSVPRTLINGTISLDARYNTGVIPNWYFQAYVSFLRRNAGLPPTGRLDLKRVGEVAGLPELLGLDDGRRIFFASSLESESVVTFAADARRYERESGARVSVLEYTGDRLVVDVDSRNPGVLCFIDNAAPGWTASVNGRPVPLDTLFGTFKAVRVDAGPSRVTWEYSAW